MTAELSDILSTPAVRPPTAAQTELPCTDHTTADRTSSVTGADPLQLQGGQTLRAVEDAQLLSPWQQDSSALLVDAAPKVTCRSALCLCSDLCGFTACKNGLANGCDPAQILAGGL